MNDLVEPANPRGLKDLVDRLRHARYDPLRYEAAEVIQRLQAELAEAKEREQSNAENTRAYVAELQGKLSDANRRAEYWKANHLAGNAELASLKQGSEPVAYQYQNRAGIWHPFIDAKHYENTKADGSWPIRALYLHPALTDRDAEDANLSIRDLAALCARLIRALKTHDPDHRLAATATDYLQRKRYLNPLRITAMQEGK